MVTLDHKLRTGDIVEILTSKHSYGPSQDWVKLAQTSQAKHKIRQFFKKQRREENVEKGRELVEKEIKNLDFELKDVLTPENIQKVADKFNFSNEEDMYAAVGYNGITALQVANRLTEKRESSAIRKNKKRSFRKLLGNLSRTRKEENGKLAFVSRASTISLSVYQNAAILCQVMILSALSQKAEGFRSIAKTVRMSKRMKPKSG